MINKALIQPHRECGAVFSPCEKYRYVLWRTWDDTLPKVVFIGLNPSTATATIDEAVTILRNYDWNEELAKCEFNGQTFYSDSVTLDDAYKAITKMTKAEFEAYEKEYRKKNEVMLRESHLLKDDETAKRKVMSHKKMLIIDVEIHNKAVHTIGLSLELANAFFNKGEYKEAQTEITRAYEALKILEINESKETTD